jgi:uncharacterized RDD family membrane protein YckC
LKYIDISTSHNISIRYELANTSIRILAWGLDMFFLIIYTVVVSIIALKSTFLFYFLIFFVFAFYHLAFEILNNGQSPGKQILKIKVVTLHGRTARAQDYFLRWIFRTLEIAGCFGIIASLYISSTEKNQRIGDILARTTVIKLSNNQLYNLNALVKMGTKKREIKYSKVTMYNDTDMMLVKDALQRHKKHPSEENRAFLHTLAQKISDDLDVKIEIKRKSQFLETVLFDYIALTR